MLTFEIFSFFQDIDKLKKICKKKPLDGNYLEVYNVRLSREIRVSNVGGSLTEDEIRYYFENRKKSDGGAIHKIKLHQELGICIVTFRQPEGKWVCSANFI